jgi:hypothetical protein
MGQLGHRCVFSRRSGTNRAFRTLLSKIDESYPDCAESLDRYLSQIQPLSEDLARAQSEGVRFMTMVGSKGLTVKATIVAGVDTDLVPRPDQVYLKSDGSYTWR